MLRNRTKDIKFEEDALNLVEPVSLNSAKAFLKINFDDDDYIIQGMIRSARELLEKQLNISITPKTVTATFTHDGCFEYPIPYGPVGEVISAQFQYCEEETVAISTSNYKVLGSEFKMFKGTAGWWTLEYKAGYDYPPQAIRDGMLKQVAWMYENRGDVAGAGQVNPDVLYMLSVYNKNTWI